MFCKKTLESLRACNFLKKTPTQVCSCETFESCRKNYFEKHLWMRASKIYLKRDSNTDFVLWILWITQEHEHLVLKHQSGGLSLIKLQVWHPEDFQHYLKEALVHVIICGFSEMFRKFFSRAPPSNHFSHNVFF